MFVLAYHCWPEVGKKLGGAIPLSTEPEAEGDSHLLIVASSHSPTRQHYIHSAKPHPYCWPFYGPCNAYPGYRSITERFAYINNTTINSDCVDVFLGCWLCIFQTGPWLRLPVMRNSENMQTCLLVQLTHRNPNEK